MKKLFKKLTLSQTNIFVVILMLTHFMNLIFNMYLGQSLDAADYGLVTFITSLLYFTNVIFLSLIATASHTVAYLQAHRANKALSFFRNTRRNGIKIALIVSLLWILSIPLLGDFFQIQSDLPLLLYVPIFSLGVIAATNRGFLQGRLQFVKAGIIMVSEALSKFLLAALLIWLGYKTFAYVAIPVSIVFSGIISLYLTKNVKKPVKEGKLYAFPIKFFATASLASLSTMAFLSLDIVIVKHFFTPVLAGQYALLAFIGKTIYFLGSLFNNFLIPFVGRDLGNGKNPVKTFYVIFSITLIAVAFGYLVFGLLGSITAPMLFGDKVDAITGFLPFYCLAIVCYTIATSITTYHLAKKEYIFPVLAIFNALLVALGLMFKNSSLEQVVLVLLVGSIINVLSVSVLHIFYTFFTDTKVRLVKRLIRLKGGL